MVRPAGDVGELLAAGAEAPPPAAPTVEICRPAARTLVVGSSQPVAPGFEDRCQAAGLVVARRHSGGGAVVLEPDGGLWVEVVLPPGDRRIDPNVSRSFTWLGRAWADALADVGVVAAVHEGPAELPEAARRVCFAGVVAGEVLDADPGPPERGRPKLVGLSQRRGRFGARFQCVAYAAWDPAPFVAVGLAGPGEVDHAGAGVGTVLPDLEAALLARLAAT